MREPILIPPPLQRRILAKNEAFARAKRELEELLELTQELLNVPEGYILQDVSQGFVPLEMLAGDGPAAMGPGAGIQERANASQSE